MSGSVRSSHVEAFRLYLSSLRRSPATIASYTKTVRHYLTHLAEHGVTAVEATADDIESYQRKLIAKPYPLPTVDTYMRGVRAFYRYLLRERLVLQNPMDIIEQPRVVRRLPKNVLTEGQVIKLLSMPDTKTGKGILQRAIMETFYSSAIRIAELCSLKLADVDTAKGMLRIRHGKGDKFRLALVGNEACLWLRAYRELVRPRYAKPDEQNFFLGYTWGRPINRQIVNRFVHAFGRKAGFRASPHSFRHAAATHMFRHGASLMQVRELLGHSLVRTTERYVEVTIGDLQKAIEKYHPRQ